MKIRPVGAELFRADRRTDMTLRAAFRNFVNAPKYKSTKCGEIKPSVCVFLHWRNAVNAFTCVLHDQRVWRQSPRDGTLNILNENI